MMKIINKSIKYSLFHLPLSCLVSLSLTTTQTHLHSHTFTFIHTHLCCMQLIFLYNEHLSYVCLAVIYIRVRKHDQVCCSELNFTLRNFVVNNIFTLDIEGTWPKNYNLQVCHAYLAGNILLMLLH